MLNVTTKPVSAGELMKKEKKALKFVVNKLISQGVPFSCGTSKSKIIYLCLEDSENRIQDRLEGMPGNETDNLLFLYDTPNIDNGFDAFLKKIVKEEPEIKLVIVDTFQLIRGQKFNGST